MWLRVDKEDNVLWVDLKKVTVVRAIKLKGKYPYKVIVGGDCSEGNVTIAEYLTMAEAEKVARHTVNHLCREIYEGVTTMLELEMEVFVP